MILQSGLPPYSYDVNLPLRADFPYSPTPIGPSGTLLEQAMFVIQAERRRFNTNPGDIHGGYYIYVHPDIPPSGPFEPKADGSTLANKLYPSVVTPNTVSGLRDQLYELMFNHAFDNQYSVSTQLTDWIRQCYPRSPSGYFPDPAEGGTRRGIWLRPLQGMQVTPDDLYEDVDLGPIDVDPHWLGGSGVFFDIDFGEVMWNPYPWFREQSTVNFHGGPNGDEWPIQATPLFPAFQTTTGSIIATNGRESDAQLILNDEDQHMSHVPSGKIRMDGYVLREQTDFLLAPSFDDFTNTTQFSNFEGGIRVFQGRYIDTARIFLTPSVQASGVYRICARNRKANYPSTIVESGIISQWPPADVKYPRSSQGYHVFNDCIWVTDVGANNSGTSIEASGLTVLSPWTGTRLWLRYASVLNSTTRQRWGANVGLERKTANTIQRLQASGSPPFTDTYNVGLYTYNDLLTFSSISDIVLTGAGAGTDQTDTVRDMMYNGTNYYILSTRSTTTQGFIHEIDGGTLAENSKNGFPTASGANVRCDGIGFGNSKKLIFSLRGFGITDEDRLVAQFELSPPSPVQILNPKPINLPWSTSNPTSIKDIIQVTSSTHLTPGTYALVMREIGLTSRQLWLFRIEEGLLQWDVLGSYLITSDPGQQATHRQILYKAID